MTVNLMCNHGLRMNQRCKKCKEECKEIEKEFVTLTEHIQGLDGY